MDIKLFKKLCAEVKQDELNNKQSLEDRFFSIREEQYKYECYAPKIKWFGAKRCPNCNSILKKIWTQVFDCWGNQGYILECRCGYEYALYD